MERAEAIKRIKAALKRRSGKAWSVSGDRGTAWGWISINVMPQDRRWKFITTNTPGIPEQGAVYVGATWPGGSTRVSFRGVPYDFPPTSGSGDIAAYAAAAGGAVVEYQWEVDRRGEKFGHMSPFRRGELANLLGMLPQERVHRQGVSISPDERELWVARAEGVQQEVGVR